MKEIPELYDAKAEAALVGSVLIDPLAYNRVRHVPADAFSTWQLQAIWKTLAAMHADGIEIDYVTLCDRLDADEMLERIGGGAYLTHLATVVPSALNVEQYGAIVTDYAQRRADVRHAQKLVSLAMHGGDEYATGRVDLAHSVLQGNPRDQGLVSVWDASKSVLEEIEYNAANPIGPNVTRDLATGLADLDRITGGLHQGLYCVAGTTTTGKTALALTIATQVALSGKRVAFFSPEMSPEDLVHRIVCAHGHVDSRRLEDGHLTPEDFTRIHRVFGWLTELPLVFSSNTTMQGIEAEVHRALPLDLIVLDGMGLITGASSEKMYQQRGELSLWAKSISDNKHVRCPVWMNLQVALKEIKHRNDKRPRLGDIYGSSEPEMWTDNLLYLYRDDAFEDDASNHTHILDVSYWKCRKRRRVIPSTVQLFLDKYGLIQGLSRAAEPLMDWMD